MTCGPRRRSRLPSPLLNKTESPTRPRLRHQYVLAPHVIRQHSDAVRTTSRFSSALEPLGADLVPKRSTERQAETMSVSVPNEQPITIDSIVRRQ